MTGRSTFFVVLFAKVRSLTAQFAGRPDKSPDMHNVAVCRRRIQLRTM